MTPSLLCGTPFCTIRLPYMHTGHTLSAQPHSVPASRKVTGQTYLHHTSTDLQAFGHTLSAQPHSVPASRKVTGQTYLHHTSTDLQAFGHTLSAQPHSVPASRKVTVCSAPLTRKVCAVTQNSAQFSLSLPWPASQINLSMRTTGRACEDRQQRACRASRHGAEPELGAQRGQPGRTRVTAPGRSQAVLWQVWCLAHMLWCDT